MPTISNGTLIYEGFDNVIANGITMEEVYANGTLVWKKYIGGESPKLLTSSATYVAGVDFPAETDITVHISGGGGGGATTDDRGAGGGYAGDIVTKTLNYSYGTAIVVAVGGGGAGAPQTAYTYGGSGGASSFDGFTAPGGTRGSLNNCCTGPSATAAYAGNHGSRETPLGTFYDGYAYFGGRYDGGGQAGLRGNGTNGDSNVNAGVNTGAGGGGGDKHTPGGACSGGSGVIVIEW